MPTYLTLGTHMDSALMYRIYWNRAAEVIHNRKIIHMYYKILMHKILVETSRRLYKGAQHKYCITALGLVKCI